MCLAVPGKIVAIAEERSDPILGCVGTVDFQGSRIDLSLAMTPEARVGDWVLVHAGFAISLLDEDDARETWEYLDQAGVAGMPAELKASESAGEEAAETDSDRGQEED